MDKSSGVGVLDKAAVLLGALEAGPATLAQLVIATSLGIVVLRSSIKIEPLTSASADELAGPMGELLPTLLPRT